MHVYSVINVAGLSVTEKDLIDVAERKRLLPGKASFLIIE